jgi:tetratricopeptide (TPR) repeat protein
MPTQAVAADPQYTAGVAAIQSEHFAEAIRQLEAYTAKEPRNADDADAQNWLGFAYRKSGNLDAAFMHYDKALAIDPKHRGAHEYLGEAYLMSGNLDKAEEHLRILDKLCWLPCEQYTMLKQAVAVYRTAHANDAAAGPTANAR